MVARLEGKNEPDRSLRVYRAGLSPAEREDVESGLRGGEVRAVFSTSALELGIDIGALDAVVCIGLPSSMMSLWQRAGRAARAGKEGAIVLIPAETPIDAYFAEHPRELFERETEPLALSLHNKRVVCQHYACAAKEAGDEERLDTPLFGDYFEAVKQKRTAGGLNLDIFYLEDPHGEVAIRGKGSLNYTLVEGQSELGEIDEFHLIRECPRGAIYRHDGRAYRVKDVIRGKKLVHLGRDFTGNETYPVINKKIRLRRRFTVADHGRVQVEKVAIDVTEFLLQVTEKDRGGKVVKTIPGAGMPQYRLPTEGTRLVLSKEIWDEIVRHHSSLRSKNALQSIERLFYNLMPTVTGPCDTQDLSSAVDFGDNGQAYVYLYDAVYDGVDLSFEAFSRMHDLVVRSGEVVRACKCSGDEGCFRCIANPRSTDVASKEVTTAILDAIDAQLQAPAKVSELADSSFSLELPEEESVPCTACGQPISGAARFCGNCGQKAPALAT
jgi:DEAD/DEAH box helicase domain-containing protein